VRLARGHQVHVAFAQLEVAAVVNHARATGSEETAE